MHDLFAPWEGQLGPASRPNLCPNPAHWLPEAQVLPCFWPISCFVPKTQLVKQCMQLY